MITCTATLVGKSPYSQSAPIVSTKDTGEGHDAFEERTWRERMHVNKDGYVFIPPMAVKNMLAETAKFLSESVPGKGKATFTKHFEAGIMVVDPMPIEPAIKPGDVPAEKLFLPSDGRRGGGSRVWKHMPFIDEWSVQCSIIVMDPILTSRPICWP